MFSEDIIFLRIELMIKRYENTNKMLKRVIDEIID
jgi:hypothetical protein